MSEIVHSHFDSVGDRQKQLTISQNSWLLQHLDNTLKVKNTFSYPTTYVDICESTTGT